MKNIRVPTLASEMGCYGTYAFWRDFGYIMNHLKQQDELDRLIQWAKRKRLSRVRAYYIELSLNIDGKLRGYKIHSPKPLFWAEWLHCARKMIFPEPEYYPKGYARKYQRRQ